MMTNGYGYPVWQGTYTPFGYEVNAQSAPNRYKFAGMEKDEESGQHHTWFRQYSPNAGRWLTPDPAGLAAVDLLNPQSWNRYAYVMSSPLNFIDPLGLSCENPHDGLPCIVTVIGSPTGFGPPAGGGSVAQIELMVEDSGGSTAPANNGNCTPGTAGCFNVPTRQQQCLSNALARNQRQQQIFAGHAGSKLIGRAAIGAGIGAWRGWTRYNRGGSPWLIVSQATVGALVGAGSSIWQDYNTIQSFDAQYIQDVQQCVVQNLAPGVPE